MKKLVILMFSFILLFSMSSSVFASSESKEEEKVSSPKLEVSTLNEGIDGVKIVPSPGMSLEDSKKILKERNEKSYAQFLAKNEDDLVKEQEKFLTEKRSDSNDQARATASAGNSFTGVGTGRGAVLLGYSETSAWWCSWLVSGDYCHAGLFDVDRNVSEFSYSIRTANVKDASGTDGMQWETPLYWKKFDEVREMSVWSASDTEKQKAVKGCSIIFRAVQNRDQ
ncbi:hypothetical protein NV379_19660 [Paenibacillus sp. N1-5-1-14]|uniref:hypothetical protein n=1 Tax=Paenibacillus radicibacter TaxID=2972488 RepID=UPI00215974D1|nr:hypothetical protein [Paenibacillus radicibacter]MCR8644874.1 hypothetical protein [Paenibacillus radicibacter]